MKPLGKIQLFNLNRGSADMDEIRLRIGNDSSIQGMNMWVLILAILIACIGLNLNNTVVVIGAMLISPLMGNIVASGYAMAAYDIRCFRDALVSLLFQVTFAVGASALYFWLSPISTPSQELLSRTEPTIWDVLIALFGGLAGAVGNTRLEKNNVIPGVAIATALLPPLCTVGYGIAIQSFVFFGGALYLFFINAFFIALASFIIFKILGVPAARGGIEEGIFQHQKRTLFLLGMIITIPSIYMAYQSVQQQFIQAQTEQYIKKEVQFTDSSVISHAIKGNVFQINLIGSPLSQQQIDALQGKMDSYPGLGKMKLKVVQNQLDGIPTEKDIQQMIAGQLQTEMLGTSKTYKELIQEYYPDYQRSFRDRTLVRALNQQAPSLFPEIHSIAGGSVAVSDQDGKISFRHFYVRVTLTRNMSLPDQGKLHDWIETQVKVPVDMQFQIN